MSTTSSAKIKDIRDERVPECLHWNSKDVANWVEELGFPYYRVSVYNVAKSIFRPKFWYAIRSFARCGTQSKEHV
jgi:hypothetical protein